VRRQESAPVDRPEVVFTIGHTTRPLAEFISLVQAHGVDLVLDVRTVPRSRHNPQFNRETFPDALEAAGIDYEHVGALGGFRRAGADSPNAGWRNASFRGYADYMQTPAFAAAIESVVDQAKSRHLALMCAEAVPWRCHRSLIADALLVRGTRVEEIVSAARTRAHVLTAFAHVEGTVVTYPPQADGP
jgi:uncharacterized protein (DUF488 family)